MFYDISLSSDGDTPHFLGSIVLQKIEDVEGLEKFTIIDGQQRMMTLTIFLLTIMKKLKENNKLDDFKGTMKYLESVDNKNEKHMIMELSHYGIVANIYDKLLTDDIEELDRISNTGFLKQCGIQNDWDKRISECFKFFYEEFDIQKYDANRIISMRNSLLNTNYVLIQADTEEDSYTIFEILNARGVELEDSELLKNYIMRHMKTDSEKNNVKNVWTRIEFLIGNKFKSFIKHYAPHMYRTTSDEIRKEPYKLIKQNCKGDSVKKLVNDLELKAKYYAKIINPNCYDDTDEACSDTEKRIFEFFKTHRFEQFRPVLLSLMHNKELEKINEETYTNVIEFIYRFIVCYNLIGRESSNKLRDTIYSYAPKLERDCSEKQITEFIKSLQKKIPNEAWFVNVFKSLGYSHKWPSFNDDKSKKKIQLLFHMMEQYLEGSDSNFTIEHINPDKDDERNSLIGNLIPLEDALNQRCKTKSVEEKMKIYKESNFKTTKMLCDNYEKRNNFDMEDRTNRLAKFFYSDILNLNTVGD